MNINITLFYQMIFFIVFVWFSQKLIWRPIINTINIRKDSIADGLAAAENGHKAEEKSRKKAERFISEAKAQANEIINNAKKFSSELIEEAKLVAKNEGDKVLNAAHAEIQVEMNKAQELLKGKISELVVLGTEQFLKRELKHKDHETLLNSLAAKISVN